MPNNTYNLAEETVLASSNVNPSFESVDEQWRKEHKGENPPQQHDDKGRLLWKVGYFTTEARANGTKHTVERFTKVPDGGWRARIGFGERIRFVHWTLTVGSLSDGGVFESLKAEDVKLVGDVEFAVDDSSSMDAAFSNLDDEDR